MARRLICELAVATGRLPSEWAGEDPADIATVILVMAKRARRLAERAGRPDDEEGGR